MSQTAEKAASYITLPTPPPLAVSTFSSTNNIFKHSVSPSTTRLYKYLHLSNRYELNIVLDIRI